MTYMFLGSKLAATYIFLKKHKIEKLVLAS
jgi:hypothetical protein